MPKRYQCLIFLVQGSCKGGRVSRQAPGCKGYALLPKTCLQKYPQINEILSKCDLKVLKDREKLNSLENVSVEAMEISMSVEPCLISVLAEEHNKEALSSLLTSKPVENIRLNFVPSFSKGHLRGLNCVDVKMISLAENFLRYDSNLRFCHPKGGSLLHWAVNRENATIVKMLLKCGADVSSVRNDGLTPLFLAVKRHSIEITGILLRNGADTEVRGSFRLNHCDYGELNSATPLLYAIKTYESDADGIIQLLLNHGANVDAQCVDGLNCLHLAVRTGCLELVGIILSSRPDINNDNNRKSFLAAVSIFDNYFEPEIVAALYEYGFRVKPEDNHFELLLFAVSKNCTPLVRDLLNFVDLKSVDELGLSISAYVLRNAAIAVCNGYAHADILKLLVEFGLDVNARLSFHESPVGKLLDMSSNVDVLKLFIEKGLIVFDNGGTREFVKCAALFSDSPEMIDILLTHGADVNASEGRAITNSVHQFKSTSILKALLKYGAEINFNGENKPLHEAVEWKCPDHFQILLDYCIPDGELYQQILNNPQYFLDLPRLEGGEEMMWRHVIKHECAYGANQNMTSNDVAKTDFRNSCLAEIERLISESIGDSVYSFHDFLVGNVNSISRYTRNENLVQVLLSEDYKSKFPIYGDVIHWQFRRGYYRRKLLDRGIHVLLLLAKSLLALPHGIIEEIVNKLANRDILMLISDRSIISGPIM